MSNPFAKDCAVSLAIKDMRNPGEAEFNVSTGFENTVVKYPHEKLFKLPRSARRFISQFDKDKSQVKPFNFIMEHKSWF